MGLEYRQQVMNELCGAIDLIDPAAVEGFETQLLNAKRIFCHGSGRSGLNARAFAMRLMHMGRETYIVGDVLTPSIREGDALLVISASGNSKNLETTVRKAIGEGASVAAITTNPDSVLYRLAQNAVLIKAPTKNDPVDEKASVAPMGTLFEEGSYILCDMIILDMMRKLEIRTADMVYRHANLE